MRAVILGLTAVAVLSAMGLSTWARANEPLMLPDSASVTPGDDVPTPAVDSLAEDVSPAATANTTAADALNDDDIGNTPTTGDTMTTPAVGPEGNKAMPTAP